MEGAPPGLLPGQSTEACREARGGIADGLEDEPCDGVGVFPHEERVPEQSLQRQRQWEGVGTRAVNQTLLGPRQPLHETGTALGLAVAEWGETARAARRYSTALLHPQLGWTIEEGG